MFCAWCFFLFNRSLNNILQDYLSNKIFLLRKIHLLDLLYYRNVLTRKAKEWKSLYWNIIVHVVLGIFLKVEHISNAIYDFKEKKEDAILNMPWWLIGSGVPTMVWSHPDKDPEVLYSSHSPNHRASPLHACSWGMHRDTKDGPGPQGAHNLFERLGYEINIKAKGSFV